MNQTELYTGFCSPKVGDYRKGEKSKFFVSLKTEGILDGWSEEDVAYVSDIHKLTARAHARQFRYNRKPYISHPEGSVFLLEKEILAPQGKHITPGLVARTLGHDGIEDCPKYWQEFYDTFRPEDFVSIVHVTKPDPKLTEFLTARIYSRVGAILFSSMYLERLARYPKLFEFTVWKTLENTYGSIDWGFYDLSSPKGIRDRLYGAKILTNPALDNSIKCAETVHNLRDIDYLKNADEEQRKKRRKKLAFIRTFLLRRVQDDGNQVEISLLEDALDFTQDYLDHLDSITVAGSSLK